MNEKEMKKFVEFIQKFSTDQLVGFQSAIAFILPMSGVSKKLALRLVAMFDMCDSVIERRKKHE